ncbi:MAG TPA: DUF6084 family protein [Planctomycetaceae bacterium]|jgi:hypothetical protein|nr:DUF6084 family protein [Planctomycetaceae bacterium]
MPELNFSIAAAEPIRFAAVPTLAFRLEVEQPSGGQPIENVLLQAQIQIDATRRRYSPEEQTGLRDLFGDIGGWSRTLRTMHWTHAQVMVPAFDDRVGVDLAVPCTFDFNVAATKYFHALQDGEVPLTFLFSGTIFYRGESGGLQATRIPWSKECQFRLPASVWRLMMDAYYPNTAWLCLERDAFEKLAAFKRSRGIPTWERAIEELMSEGPDASKPISAGSNGQSEP